MIKSAYDDQLPFRVFYDRASEKGQLIEVVSTEIQNIGLQISNILDVGCNDGRFSSEVLYRVGEMVSPQCTYMGVDPCSAALKRFNYEGFPDSISISLEAASIESFLGRYVKCPSKRIKHYDLTMVAHSIYWISNLNSIVHELIDVSRCTIFIVRGKRGVFSIQNIFRSSVPNLWNNRYNVDDICGILDKIFSFYRRVEISTKISLQGISECETRELISFILDTPISFIPMNVIGEAKRVLKGFGDEIPHDVYVLICHSNRYIK